MRHLLTLALIGLAACAGEATSPSQDPSTPPAGPMAVSTPSGFTAFACHIGGVNPTWVRYDVTWSGGTTGETFSIAEQTSNDTTSPNGVYAGDYDYRPFAMDGHRTTDLPHNYYYFIRFSDGSNNSAWVPLSENPLSYSHCSV